MSQGQRPRSRRSRLSELATSLQEDSRCQRRHCHRCPPAAPSPLGGRGLTEERMRVRPALRLPAGARGVPGTTNRSAKTALKKPRRSPLHRSAPRRLRLMPISVGGILERPPEPGRNPQAALLPRAARRRPLPLGASWQRELGRKLSQRCSDGLNLSRHCPRPGALLQAKVPRLLRLPVLSLMK